MSLESRVLKSRTRILIENSLASLLTRASNIIITLILVPLSIHALGIENYAIIAMIIAFSIFFTFSDLGLGSAIVKAISEIDDKKNNLVDAVRTISNAWFFLWILTFLIFLLVILIYRFNLIDNHIVLIVSILIGINLPFSIYIRILFAMQKNLQSGLWQTGGKLLSLIIIYIFFILDKININNYIYIFFGMPLIINIIGSFFVFKKYNYLCPNKSLVDYREAIKVIKVGIMFIVLQIVPYVETGLDNIILSFKYNLNFIGTYDVYLKLFLYVPALISVGAFPLWPAVAKAMAEGDIKWVMKLKNKIYSLLIFLALLMLIFLVLFSENIIFFWTKKNLLIEFEILIMLGMVCFLYSLSIIQAMFLNGFGLIKEQVLFYIIYLPLIIISKILLVNIFGILQSLIFLVFLMVLKLLYMENLIFKSLSFKKLGKDLV